MKLLKSIIFGFAVGESAPSKRKCDRNWEKFKYLTKIELDKKVWSKIERFAKTRNFGQKSKILSKIQSSLKTKVE